MISRISRDKSRPIYAAKAAGSNCDKCPFNARSPVGPVWATNGNPRLIILGESPGHREDESGKPFVGASGYLLNSSFKQFGVDRSEVHITNTVLCRPKEKATKEDWEKAVECCKPRLEKELENVTAHEKLSNNLNFRRVVNNTSSNTVILACGNHALKVLTGKTGIFDWMGGPIETKYGVVVPSIHPAFALRTPAYIPVFKTFLARALRIANGTENYPFVWPEFVWKPPYADGLRRLLSTTVHLSVDIENNPNTKELRCIGVGTTNFVVSVYLQWATPEDLQLLHQLLSTPRTKVLQNGVFDRVELEKSGHQIVGPFEDTLLQHAVLAPRLPHKLTLIAAIELPAERWKTIFGAKGDDKEDPIQLFASAPPEKLLPYNCKDVAAQAMLHESYNDRLTTTHRGHELYRNYLELNEIGLKMHKCGVMINKDALMAHKETITGLLTGLSDKFLQFKLGEAFRLGVSGTHPSLAKLFFEKFKAPPVAWSDETHEPSLNAKALTYYVGYFTSNRATHLAQLCRIILQYRKNAKLLTSYIDNVPVDETSHVHPLWRVNGARTGRWSATGPAIQTIPGIMRDIFVARPGHMFAKADYKQLEVRILAFLSGAPLLLEWFEKGFDVHAMTAEAIFGDKNIPLGVDRPRDHKFDCDKTKKCVVCLQRTLCKRVIFGLIYGGTTDTLWKALIVDFPGVTFDQVEMAVTAFLATHHHVREWQAKVISDTQKAGFVEEELSGRRQYYHDGRVTPTEPPNYKIQGGAGELVNRAIKRVDAHVQWGEERILAQVHDELLLEGIDSNHLRDVLLTAMEEPVTHNNRTMIFPADVGQGLSWGTMHS